MGNVESHAIYTEGIRRDEDALDITVEKDGSADNSVPVASIGTTSVPIVSAVVNGESTFKKFYENNPESESLMPILLQQIIDDGASDISSKSSLAETASSYSDCGFGLQPDSDNNNEELHHSYARISTLVINKVPFNTLPSTFSPYASRMPINRTLIAPDVHDAEESCPPSALCSSPYSSVVLVAEYAEEERDTREVESLLLPSPAAVSPFPNGSTAAAASANAHNAGVSGPYGDPNRVQVPHFNHKTESESESSEFSWLLEYVDTPSPPRLNSPVPLAHDLCVTRSQLSMAQADLASECLHYRNLQDVMELKRAEGARVIQEQERLVESLRRELRE
ncbi:hypothetical protein D9758_011296 [Tetrapyrgos nigripes]|uniref:Uncharacterized protein n=1 Tax=Tetrapyrgos nigripes TaxID=182062 RepID=A0A8H5CT03_9AGAR|nr:hypothetical protein D9758_011296 [Tetrapyrgos nigripes]